MPKFVLIIGPQAVGKMTVGQELAKITELKLYYDLSDKDIADIVGINNAAVRKRIQRAKEILRKKLAKRSEDNVSI